MPALRRADNDVDDGGRITYITCSEGLEVADWLPWPLRRRHPNSLPTLATLFEQQAEEKQTKENARNTVVNPDDEEENDEEEDEKISTTSTLTSSTCSPRSQYALSKLALVVHSHDLDQRLARNPQNRNVVSNVVDPGALDNFLGRSMSKKPVRPSLRSKVMGYFPPVWVLKKVWSLLYTTFDFGGFGLREVNVGVGAVYHVATSRHLGARGGHLYGDSSGVSFINCGLELPSLCGRVHERNVPRVVTKNKKMSNQLFKWTKKEIFGTRSNPKVFARGGVENDSINTVKENEEL